MFPLAFVAGWLQGHWWGFISRNYVVWHTFFLMNVSIALKGSHFRFYIVRRAPKPVNSQRPYWISRTAATAFQLAGLVQIANANTWRQLLLVKANRTAWNSGGGLFCHRSCHDGLRRWFAGELSHFSIQGRNDRRYRSGPLRRPLTRREPHLPSILVPKEPLS